MSGRKRYTRSQRLRTADIAGLLGGSRPLRSPGLVVQVRMNALGGPRLAIIVPKRIFPRAVDRNRMKRLVREWFRCRQAQLGSRDILVRLTGKTAVVANISELLAGSP
ncbi:MAG: ribonuclease P protein component [Burkholderiales bacterium]